MKSVLQSMRRGIAVESGECDGAPPLGGRRDIDNLPRPPRHTLPAR
jgi:hypothetical protein